MEAAYQYIWKYGLYARRGKLVDGRAYEVHRSGRLNTGAGPDFADAQVSVDGVRWVGDAEIHVKATDWHAHGHDGDPAYDKVILHAVGADDCRINRPDGSQIPQLLITPPADFVPTYARLITGLRGVKCAEDIRTLWPLPVNAWLERMGMERLQTKSERVIRDFESTGSWQQAIFITLSRALGFGINSEPMEMVARSLPFNYIGRHLDHPFQVEALLFGQAGLLDGSTNIFDEYFQQLCSEYRFLAVKYELRPISPSLWKCSGSRPQNFPHRRLALLAQLICSGQDLLSRFLECCEDVAELQKIFNLTLPDYWKCRHRFTDAESRPSSGKLSQSSLQLLLINAVAPVLYAYGSLRGDERAVDAAIDMLTKLPAESNYMVRTWVSAGLDINSAYRSQAVIHLHREYCDCQRCKECGIAFTLLKAKFSGKNEPDRSVPAGC